MRRHDDIAIGDPVEVRFVERDRGEFWRPGTVVSVEAYGAICVAYANHDRQVVERRHWRSRP